MRRKVTFLITLWWLILFGALGVCLLLFTNKSPVVSEAENRTLAGMPAVTLQLLQDGGLDEAFERFLCDKFFLRSEIVDGAKAVKHLFSALTVDELLGSDEEDAFIPALTAETETQDAAASAEISGEQAQAHDDAQEETVAQRNETSQSVGDTAGVWLEQSDGTRTELLTYSREQIQKAADVFNLYAALLPEGGTLHVLLTPRAQTVNKLALHLDTERGLSSEVESALQPLVSKNVVVHSLYEILPKRAAKWRICIFPHRSSLDGPRRLPCSRRYAQKRGNTNRSVVRL
jgi:hypothetical protein